MVLQLPGFVSPARTRNAVQPTQAQFAQQRQSSLSASMPGPLKQVVLARNASSDSLLGGRSSLSLVQGRSNGGWISEPKNCFRVPDSRREGAESPAFPSVAPSAVGSPQPLCAQAAPVKPRDGWETPSTAAPSAVPSAAPSRGASPRPLRRVNGEALPPSPGVPQKAVEVPTTPATEERDHSPPASPGSVCSYKLVKRAPMVQRMDDQELASTSVFCSSLEALEAGQSGAEPREGPELTALRQRRERAEARVLAAEEQLLGLDEQEWLLLSRGKVIGCQRLSHEAKLRALRERRVAAQDELLAATAQVDRRRSAEALLLCPAPSVAPAEARPLEPEQCRSVRVVKAPRTARSPRAGSSVVVEGLASRNPSPRARSSLGGSVSVPVPGRSVVARSETTSSVKVRSSPGSAQSPPRSRQQQQSPQRSRPQSPPAQPAAPVPMPPRRQTSGLLERTGVARGTKSPIRMRPQSPRSDLVKGRLEVSREPKALTARIGFQQKGSDLKARLAALPEEELCQLLTSLPRDRLEGALAVCAHGHGGE